MRRLLLLFCLLALLWQSPRAKAANYDLALQRWGQFYFPWSDWQWFRSQARAESNLDQAARSWCGAIGVMQLMPATAAELRVNPFDAEQNIQGGVKYDRQIWGLWTGLAGVERYRFMFASYNWGAGNVRRAARANGAWPAETRGYVARIEAFYMGGR